jgi:DNA primase
VVGYDGDAVESIKYTASELSRYFEVLIADIPDPGKDWEDLSEQEIYEVFAYRLRTPVEYRINKIQQI